MEYFNKLKFKKLTKEQVINFFNEMLEHDDSGELIIRVNTDEVYGYRAELDIDENTKLVVHTGLGSMASKGNYDVVGFYKGYIIFTLSDVTKESLNELIEEFLNDF